MLNRAYFVFDAKAATDDEAREIEGMATTPDLDVYGDIVEPKGAIYKLPIPFLWQHRSGEPIGQVIAAKVESSGIKVRVKLAKIDEPGKLKERLDEAWQSIKSGLVMGLSIGFKADDYDLLPNGGRKFSKWRWMELSAVTFPANEAATISAVKAAFGHEDGATKPGATGRNPISLRGPAMKVTLADQLSRLEQRHAANLARIEEIVTKSAEEDRTMDDTEIGEHDELKAENDRLAGEISRVKGLLVAKGQTARPAREVREPSEPAPVRVEVRSPVALQRKAAPGIGFARFARVKGLSYLEHAPALDVAKGLYPDDPALHQIVAKTGVAAGTTAHVTWAGPLVGDESTLFADFVEFLRPTTIVGRFGVGGIPALRMVPFRTRLLGQSSGGAGYWVGEGQGKPLTKFDFTSTTLEPLKVANIAVVTMELLRDSSPSAEMLLRDQLAAALRERLDIDFIDPTKVAVSNVSPASITNGVTPIPSSGSTAAAVRADIAAAMSAFIAANNIPSAGVWVMSAQRALKLSMMQNPLGQREFPTVSMMGGTLEGLPVITSEYIQPTTAGDYAVLVNASDIWVGDEGQIAVDMSREASLQMDDAPSINGTTPTAAQLVSLWQTNCVGFKAERTISWAKRRTSAVALIEGITWGDLTSGV